MLCCRAVSIPGLFDMSLKNLGFLGFFKKPKKNLKSPNLGFLGFLKNKKPNVRFKFLSFLTYYATNLIEMLSNFPINMNCIFLRSHGRIFAVSSSMVIHNVCGTV